MVGRDGDPGRGGRGGAGIASHVLITPGRLRRWFRRSSAGMGTNSWRCSRRRPLPGEGDAQSARRVARGRSDRSPRNVDRLLPVACGTHDLTLCNRSASHLPNVGWRKVPRQSRHRARPMPRKTSAPAASSGGASGPSAVCRVMDRSATRDRQVEPVFVTVDLSYSGGRRGQHRGSRRVHLGSPVITVRRGSVARSPPRATLDICEAGGPALGGVASTSGPFRAARDTLRLCADLRHGSWYAGHQRRSGDAFPGREPWCCWRCKRCCGLPGRSSMEYKTHRRREHRCMSSCWVALSARRFTLHWIA